MTRGETKGSLFPGRVWRRICDSADGGMRDRGVKRREEAVRIDAASRSFFSSILLGGVASHVCIIHPYHMIAYVIYLTCHDHSNFQV